MRGLHPSFFRHYRETLFIILACPLREFMVRAAAAQGREDPVVGEAIQIRCAEGGEERGRRLRSWRRSGALFFGFLCCRGEGGWGAPNSIYRVFPIKGKMEPAMDFQHSPPSPNSIIKGVGMFLGSQMGNWGPFWWTILIWRDSPANANKQWFPLVSRWCRDLSTLSTLK